MGAVSDRKDGFYLVTYDIRKDTLTKLQGYKKGPKYYVNYYIREAVSYMCSDPRCPFISHLIHILSKSVFLLT